MSKQALIRRLLLGVALGAAVLSAPVVVGSLTPAHAQVSIEFRAALEPYGEWRRSARYGEVWVPDERPNGWRPYSEGHWVYTDDWGWYWVADNEEADWGWVTYHYGRWVHDRESWFWVPGDEWAPAWVDWRRGNDYVGWAPLPPEEMIDEDEYRNDPGYWVFVQPRYMIAPRLRTYYLPRQRSVIVFRQTVVVNRTVRLEHNRNRFAVNPGIAPGIIGLAAHRPVQMFRVQPRVLAGTQGVIGAVQVRPQDFGRRGQPRAPGANPLHATIQATTTVIQPVKSVPKAQALGKDERGRLGDHPPRAAQGGTIAPPPPPAAKVAPVTQTPPAGPAPRSGLPAVTTPVTPRPTGPTVAPVQPKPAGPAPTNERRDVQPQTGNPPAGAGGNVPAVRQGNPPPPPPPQPKVTTPPPVVHAPPPPVVHAPPPPVVHAPPPPVVHAPPPPVVHAPPPPAARQAAPPPPPPARQAAPPPPPPPAARAPAPPPPPAARQAPPPQPKPGEQKQDAPK